VRILLINHYAGSVRHGMEYRPYYLAREWVRMGHAVRILAASRSHVRSVQPEVAAKPVSESIDQIEYVWYPTPPYRGNGAGRVLNMATFVSQVWGRSHAISTEFRPDVVIASSTYPMDIWPAQRIAKHAGARLVFEVHDLWPLSPMELGGMSRWHPFIKLVRWAESYAYRHADVVVSMLPKARDYMQSRGMPPSAFRYIPNGIDPTEWTSSGALAPDIGAALEAVRKRGRLLVAYTGAHGLANALDVLLDAAKLLKGTAEVILVGDGPERERLALRVKNERLENVTMLGPIPKNSIPALLQAIDVAYIGLQSQPLFRFGISPNKLMDYMMSGRPVVMAIAAGNDPVTQANCGVTVPPDDPAAIAAAVRELSCTSAEARAQLGANGRRHVLERHSYDVLARRFLQGFSVSSTAAYEQGN
jgi:glycosyltransferase involved in cell wall biosynthesis